MSRLVLYSYALLFSVLSFAQTPNRYVDHGLMRVQGNLAFGTNTKTSGKNIYWVGDLDYYLKNNISITGGTYFFVATFDGDKLFKHNHSGYLGASYHFKTNNHIDPFVSILPGFSVNQLNSGFIVASDSLKPASSYPMAINPLFSVGAGVTYYANRFFNVFAKLQYQTGKHFSDVPPVPLNEVKVSFGLGYMIWVRKHYLRFRKPEDVSQ